MGAGVAFGDGVRTLVRWDGPRVRCGLGWRTHHLGPRDSAQRGAFLSDTASRLSVGREKREVLNPSTLELLSDTPSRVTRGALGTCTKSAGQGERRTAPLSSTTAEADRDIRAEIAAVASSRRRVMRGGDDRAV